MKPLRYLILSLAVSLTLIPGFIFGAEKPTSDPKEALKPQTTLFQTALASKDAKTLASLYADDARWIRDGEVITGRDQIEKEYSRLFAEDPELKIDSPGPDEEYFVTPDVIVERGVKTVSGNQFRYVYTNVKKGDKWFISFLDETSIPSENSGREALEGLSWMVGTWKENSPDVEVTATTGWTINEHFLRRSFSVVRKDGTSLQGTEIVGYDPVREQIRSWIFDSDGGFGEGYWHKEGNQWVIQIEARGPDGSFSTSETVLTLLSSDKIQWESRHRTLNGNALPDIQKIDIFRSKES